ncbi:host attachment protein [Legionella saoudiensis]|uniref:host attachment protein n=1 Tax=Legionella saoudiensis TaxID=1750561 RepID=UPI000730AB96|nr:host attachment protein [Legionella saoudiensis]
MKDTTWILTADSNRCKLYQVNKKPYQALLVKEIQHPASKLRDVELTADKSGHYQTSNGSHGAFTQQSAPKEIEIDNFARHIAEELDKGRTAQDYNHLTVIAPPHMNGLILQHINKEVKKLITQNIIKDVMHLTEQDLTDFLHEHVEIKAI